MRAAVEARRGRNFFIVARSDALAVAGICSFALYATVTAGNGRPLIQGLRQFANAYARWSDGDEDLLH